MRPSTSVAERVPVIVVSSSPETEISPDITLRSSTGVILRETSCLVVPPRSSVTVTVKESVPK